MAMTCLFLTFCAILIIFIFKIYIKTATMAVVMAFGIITQGVLSNFFQSTFTQSLLSDFIISIVIALWISFFFSVCMTIIKDKFRSLHYDDLINRFGMGTWIAASSICCITLNKHVNEAEKITIFVAIFNILLWLVYMIISVRSYQQIHKSHQDYKVHGIIFLTTVSTQSLVLLLSTFNNPIPTTLSAILITIGLTFYVINLIFVFQRYSKDTWSIETDWNNTNCIIHGALSISGLACIMSKTTTSTFLDLLWTSTLLIFLIIESIEIYRLYRRIRTYGITNGVFIYHVTQWSRIFTFAMFYAFTFLMESHTLLIPHLKTMIIEDGIWIILCLTMIEIGIWVSSVVELGSKKYSKLHLHD